MSMRTLFSCWLLIFLAATGAFAAPERSGRILFEIDLSQQSTDGETRLWLPFPVEDSYQSIDDVKVEGTYDFFEIRTDATGTIPVLYASWMEGQGARTLRFEFQVHRKEVVHRELPTAEPSWNPEDFAPWLGSTAWGPIDGEVKALADSITQDKTTVFGKARAIYDWTVENMYRDPETKGCGLGDVKTLLAIPGGKCADIHSVYVALARAAGVPAREVFGIRQGKTPRQDITGWQHCWAEFYLPGYGWVVVDPGDVRKAMLKEDLTLDDPQTEEYRTYYWGNVDPYRVRFNTGRDLELVPQQEGGPLNYLMYPFAQVGSRTIDWLDPSNFQYRITYFEL